MSNNAHNEISSEIDRKLIEAGIASQMASFPYGEIAAKLNDAYEALDGAALQLYEAHTVAELIEQLSSSDADTDSINHALMAHAYNDLYADLIKAEAEWFAAE